MCEMVLEMIEMIVELVMELIEMIVESRIELCLKWLGNCRIN